MTAAFPAGWVADCIAWLAARGRATIEPTEQAEARWMAQLITVANRTVYPQCNSWYLGANIAGKPRMFMAHAGGFPAYAEQCAAVAQRDYDGFVVD